MKTKILTVILSLAATFAFAHGNVELGPNGGRIVEFSKDESIHGEVLVRDGKFHVNVLDKNMKPVKIDKQSITATAGTREKPEKLTVEKDAAGFKFPLIKEGQWLILQFKDSPESKAVTARLEYDTSTCDDCKKPEWLCSCAAEKK